MGKSYEASERVLAEKPNLEDLNAKEPTLPNNYKSAERITAYEIILNSDNTSSLVVSPLFYQKYEEGKDMRRAMYFSNKEGYDISAKTVNQNLNARSVPENFI